MATDTKVKPMINEDDDVIVYIDPAKRAIVTIALLVGFFGVHFYMRAFSMCTSYILAQFGDVGQYYSAGKALQTAIMVVATAVSTYLIPKWGIKKIMGGSLIIILLCDIGTLVAPNLGIFLACVMLQGIGNAGYVANMISLMNKVWPKSKRAMWLSTIGITQGIAAVAVPTLSGAMIDMAGWKSVYYLMMGIQALGFVTMMIVTPSDTTQKNYTPKKFDAVGTVLFLIWVSACVLAMNFGNSWKWNSGKIIGLLAATVIGLVAFIIYEYKMGSKAIFPVKLFTENINCTLIFIQAFFACAVCMGQFVFIIYYMQVVMKTGAAISAIPFTIFSIGTLVMPTIYAMWYKKSGHCKPQLILTMLFLTANCFLYGLLLTPTSSLAMIYAIAFIGGLGHAAWVTICYNAAEEYLPKSRIADGNQVAYIAICIAGSVGLAIMQAIANAVAAGQKAAGVEAITASGNGYTTAMFVAGICGLLGVAAAAALSAKAKENGAEN